jgi:hypothetical protein
LLASSAMMASPSSHDRLLEAYGVKYTTNKRDDFDNRCRTVEKSTVN